MQLIRAHLAVKPHAPTHICPGPKIGRRPIFWPGHICARGLSGLRPHGLRPFVLRDHKCLRHLIGLRPMSMLRMHLLRKYKRCALIWLGASSSLGLRPSSCRQRAHLCGGNCIPPTPPLLFYLRRGDVQHISRAVAFAFGSFKADISSWRRRVYLSCRRRTVLSGRTNL